MAAHAARPVELAGAGQFSIVKRNGVRIVFPSHLYREFLKLEAVTLLRVSDGFFDLADHT
jgi:hypothetical protein